MTQIKRLFEPITIGNAELKNRLVMLGIGTHFAENDRVTERLTDFIVERAKGGAGLIFLGTVFPSDLGQPDYGNIGLYSDEFIPGLRKLTDAVHDYDAKIAAQLILRYQWRKGKDAPLEFVAPSEVVTGPGINPPRALRVDEIHQIAEEYGEAARRAREAGFDAIDICCIAGYLINRFLSPLSNRRNDEYGGSLKNRMRFFLDIINSAKAKAGDDYTLMCRLTIDDFMKGGNSLEESKAVARTLEAEGIGGLITYVGWHECPVPTSQASVLEGAFVYMSEELKRVVNIPVVATNRINSPILADRIVADGKADLVGMARPFIADAELPNKAKEGRFEDICPCICCNHCLDLAVRGKPMACSVNPRVGREAEYTIEPAMKPKKIFVVGGGPAGMEAAAVAASRGHKVTLWERESRLGGQLIAASIPPHKKELAAFRDYQTRRAYRSGAQIKLGEEITEESIGKMKPDAIVVATGASAGIPDIPGVNGSNVVTTVDVLLGLRDVGQRVIIVGGGMVGCETAEFLVGNGRTVTILEMLKRIGDDIGPSTRWVIMKRLRQAGVKMEAETKVTEVTNEGVKALRNGSPEFFEGDTIVLAVGVKANDRLLKELRAKFNEVYPIGDCVEPHRITEATEGGLRIGRLL